MMRASGEKKGTPVLQAGITVAKGSTLATKGATEEMYLVWNYGPAYIARTLREGFRARRRYRNLEKASRPSIRTSSEPEP